jgi:hypothetical protein
LYVSSLKKQYFNLIVYERGYLINVNITVLFVVDVIGFVESIKKCVTAGSGKKGSVSFTLKDLRYIST